MFYAEKQAQLVITSKFLNFSTTIESQDFNILFGGSRDQLNTPLTGFHLILVRLQRVAGEQ